MSDRIELLNHVQGLPRQPPSPVADLDQEIRAFVEQLPVPGGRATTVAVLDSGVSRHWYLTDRLAPVGGAAAGDEWWDLSSPELPRDTGHGTAVAGVVRQYAPRAAILSRRVIDRAGDSHDDVLSEAVRELILYSPDVLNLSLGPGHHGDGSVTATPRTAAAVAALQDQCGTIVVVAAGYKDDGWPQAELTVPGERTLIVGASTANGAAAEFSDDLDVRIWARGVDVLVPFLYWNGLVEIGDDTEPGAGLQPAGRGHAGRGHAGRGHAAVADQEPEHFAGWAEWTGTSFAAPAVAGAVADAIGRDTTSTDQHSRRLAGLRSVLANAVRHEDGRLGLNALPSLNPFYTSPTAVD
jgi:subtilisin family serine protease